MNRRFQVVKNDDGENSAEEGKCPDMAVKEHLLALHGISAHKRFARIPAPHAEDLDRHQLPSHPHLGCSPIDFRFPGTLRIQGDYGLSRAISQPLPGMPDPQSDRYLRSRKPTFFNKTRIDPPCCMPLLW